MPMHAILCFTSVGVGRKSEDNFSFSIVVLTARHVGVQELVQDCPYLGIRIRVVGLQRCVTSILITNLVRHLVSISFSSALHKA